MIILPERNVPRGKILLPQRPSEWRQPSQRRTTFGIEDQTRFRLTARLDDGHIAWRGWFDDREDADAFLCAMAGGSLPFERELWDLPVETWMPGYGYGNVGWRPDFEEGLSYEFATTIFLTAGTGVQTWTKPGDWNNASNSGETLGAGGSAGGGQTGGAGGAGAYNKSTNMTVSGATTSYQIGQGGTANTSTGVAGTSGTDTFFGAATLGASLVGSKAGNGGGAGPSGTAGAGGVAASGVGAGFNGGPGAAGIAGSGGSGGGGAAGSTAAGGAGASGTGPGGGGGGADNGATGNASGTTGGTGAHGGGSGGAGSSGVPAGGAGGPGAEWDGSHGSGGGGGGGEGGASPTAGGQGGLYGAGSGGGGNNNISVACPVGAQGIVVLIYTPQFAIFMNPRKRAYLRR